MTDKSASELLQEWLTLEERHRSLQNEYFPVHAVEPGKPIKAGRPITPEALEEMDRVDKARAAAHDAYEAALRRRHR